MTKVDTFLAGQGPASRSPTSWLGPFVAGFTRLWTRMHDRGSREHPADRGVRARAGAPLDHGHADLVVPDPPAAALHGQGLVVEAAGRSAWVLSALGGFPVTRGTADREALSAASPCSRPASRWCCSPRASASPARWCSRCSTARLRGPQGGRADRAVGIGGSERVMPKGSRFIHPRKVHVDHRRADHARRRARGPRAAGCRAGGDRRAPRRRCSRCSTGPAPRPTG